MSKTLKDYIKEIITNELNTISVGNITGGPQMSVGDSREPMYKDLWKKDKDKKLKTASPVLHSKKS